LEQDYRNLVYNPHSFLGNSVANVEITQKSIEEILCHDKPKPFT